MPTGDVMCKKMPTGEEPMASSAGQKQALHATNQFVYYTSKTPSGQTVPLQPVELVALVCAMMTPPGGQQMAQQRG